VVQEHEALPLGNVCALLWRIGSARTRRGGYGREVLVEGGGCSTVVDDAATAMFLSTLIVIQSAAFVLGGQSSEGLPLKGEGAIGGADVHEV
jgi:hypothetical protein